MLNCKDVTHLVSQSLDRRLSWRERLGVRLHLMICEACARFARQMQFLRAAARRMARQNEPETETLSDQARERIGRALGDG